MNKLIEKEISNYNTCHGCSNDNYARGRWLHTQKLCSKVKEMSKGYASSPANFVVSLGDIY